MASTAHGDYAAQQAQEGRQARRALASGNTATGKPWNPGTTRILEHRVAREETPFRGSEDEGYSDQRSNQAEQRHALKVKGVGEGLKGYPVSGGNPPGVMEANNALMMKMDAERRGSAAYKAQLAPDER